MPITTPETEKLFQQYGSALEVKTAAKASLAMLNIALSHGGSLEPALSKELKNIITQVQKLMDAAQEVVSRLRPIKLEDRGYSYSDRGWASFVQKGGCDGGCGGCGGGNCGNP